MGLNIRLPFVAALTLALALGGSAFAQVIGVSINIAPPVLPVYEQPPVPAPGYIWTPGYWAETDGDYYWVPGTWVEPPQVGLLWTPGYWAASGDGFVWNAGYWAPEIGFYGGVNYGFGYGGVGFEGGHWDNGQFFYNRTVTNVSDTHITTVYEKTVVNNVTVNNVSFNGGKGGTTARPTAQELAVAHQSHVAATSSQVEHQHAASTNKQLFASVNHGKPSVAATQKPSAFSGTGVVAARNTAQTAHAQPQSEPKAAPEPGYARPHAPAAGSVAPRPGDAGKQNDAGRQNKEQTKDIARPANRPQPSRPDRPAEPPHDGQGQKPPGGQ
jgi:WXXGXW repeat (2 copies)